MPHRAQAVGNDEHRPPLADRAHVLLNDGLALVVERTGGLVEDQDARLPEQRSRDRDALALSARQPRALLPHHRVVALGQLGDEVVRPGELGRVDHRLDRRGWIGDGDVLPHRSVEQHVLLQHDADLAAQLRRVGHGDVLAVDQHPTRLRHEQPLQQLGQRALARAAASHDADHLARVHRQVHPVQHRLRVGAVAEGDVLQRHVAAHARHRAGALRPQFGAGVEHVAQARHRDAGLLEVCPHLRDAHDRLRDAAGEHVERDELAHAQVAFDDQLRAPPQRGRVDQLADEVDALVAVLGQRLGAERRRHVGGELLIPLARHLRLQRAGLDGLDAGDRLHQQALVLGAARELLVEPASQHRHDRQAQDQVQRQRDQHDQRQRRAVAEHHRDEDHREQHVQHQRERVAGEELSDVLELAHPRHRVADTPRLEVGQRQAQQVAKQPRAQLHVDAARGVAEDVGA